MTFNNITKEELNKMAKHCGINITYYDGYILEFNKVNVHAITPHQLVFSKNGYYLTVLHYFSDRSTEENDKGEHIYINYFGDNAKQKIDLRYNITLGLAGETYGEKTPVTPEQKSFVYNELVKAVQLASTITIDNMKKRDIQKKLV